jgi:hypothetical protein
VFDALSARAGFELTKIPLTPPATTQEVAVAAGAAAEA